MAVLKLEPQTEKLMREVLAALKPPPSLTLSLWADTYRKLSAEAAAAPGQWRTDNAPYQREIMDAISDVHLQPRFFHLLKLARWWSCPAPRSGRRTLLS